jgi:hypothetical protein
LFLSIEVGKAMNEVVRGREAGDLGLQEYAQRMVDCFTDQLNESNPILNEISEAMTEEGLCQQRLAQLSTISDTEALQWQKRLLAATERKSKANACLLECSARYNAVMKRMRESRIAVSL